MPGKGMSSWHEWWLEMSLGVITLNQNRNDKVSSGSIQGHYHQKIQGHPHKCRNGYADILLWPKQPPSDRLPAERDKSDYPALLANLDHPSRSDQIETTRQDSVIYRAYNLLCSESTTLLVLFIFDGHVLQLRSETVAVRRQINDFYIIIMTGGKYGLNFLTFVSQFRKKPGEKFQPANWPNRGSNSVPLGEAVVVCYLMAAMYYN